MNDLIVRLEKAIGPDRELADAVLMACGWQISTNNDHEVVDWVDPKGCYYGPDLRPDPTTSIDAALVLMPDLTWLKMDTGTQTNGHHFQWPIVSCGSQKTGKTTWRGQAKTLAIALSIAALKSRLLAAGKSP